MLSYFRWNPAFMEELDHSPALVATKQSVARSIAENANDIAHRIMPAGKGAVIEVVEDGEDVVVANTAHGGHIDEWGSVKNPPYAPLRRGAEASGVRFREG